MAGLQDSPTTALVLAGGKGERLRPLTDDRPKPMVLINGLPILEHHLHWLRTNGISRAVLLTGHLHEVISDYFSEPRIEGLAIEWVVEEHPLGRGGAIRHGFETAGITADLVIATNGDVLTEQPLEPLVALHRASRPAATILLAPLFSQLGIVDAGDDGLVRSFEEKPRLPYWINAGVYVLSAGTLAEFPREGDHETSTFPALAAAGRLAALKSEAYWRSIESPKDLREAGERLAAGG
jgi:NDP-sugar pyrophosphorylase family protein